MWEDYLGEWYHILSQEIRKDYFLILLDYIKEEKKNKKIYPPNKLIFNALKLTSPKLVKVLLLGQDPYHTPNVAHGLSFSSLQEKRPPSLRNIFEEIKNDMGYDNYEFPSNNLTKWAEQGVLLLNTILTVEQGKPLSHAGIGWEIFTNYILTYLSNLEQPIVVMLWGKEARKYSYLFFEKHNKLILETDHPASAIYNKDRWFGNKHFSQCNEFLIKNNLAPIDWYI